jgi:hypothetical protein
MKYLKLIYSKNVLESKHYIWKWSERAGKWTVEFEEEV